MMHRDLILKFGGYGFNKSHSTRYAVVAYQTAYMKTYHPVEYMAALLTFEMGSTDKVVEYIEECRRMTLRDGTKGIRVLPPDVNISDKDFTPVYVDAAELEESGNAFRGAHVDVRVQGGAASRRIDFALRRLARCALDLLVAAVADQQDVVVLAGEALRLGVHLGDQRAGRVDRAQAAFAGIRPHLRGDAVPGKR